MCDVAECAAILNRLDRMTHWCMLGEFDPARLRRVIRSIDVVASGSLWIVATLSLSTLTDFPFWVVLAASSYLTLCARGVVTLCVSGGA